MISGALDRFVEEDIRYAQRMLTAGVPTNFHVSSGAYHGFDLAEENARLGRAFYAEVDKALSLYFRKPNLR